MSDQKVPTNSSKALSVSALLGALAMMPGIEDLKNLKTRRSGHPGSKRYHTDTKRKKKIAKMSRRANRG